MWNKSYLQLIQMSTVYSIMKLSVPIQYMQQVGYSIGLWYIHSETFTRNVKLFKVHQPIKRAAYLNVFLMLLQNAHV